jgi:hypothetical protein
LIDRVTTSKKNIDIKEVSRTYNQTSVSMATFRTSRSNSAALEAADKDASGSIRKFPNARNPRHHHSL